MPNIIAVIWDFDKTLVNGYMQDPIFQEYKIDAGTFWSEVKALPKKYKEQQGEEIRVNSDTVYLNHMLKYVREGRFAGLSNAKLKELGGKISYYAGIPEIFPLTLDCIKDVPGFQECDIKVEHYVISSGIAQMIRGSTVAQYMTGIWGCEFVDRKNPETGEDEISEVVYSIDNTTKTRAIYEINKGVGVLEGIDVNSKLDSSMRRVQFKNMIYIADGPSDIPAFSMVSKNGGATYAVYPHGKQEAMRQVESLRQDGRVQLYGEANYREGEHTALWLVTKVQEIAGRIVKEEKEKLSRYIKPPVGHLA